MYNRANYRRIPRKMLSFSLWAIAASVLFPVFPALAQETAGDSNPLAALQSLLATIQGYLVGALNGIDSLGAIAPLVFLALYVVVTIAFIPASVVTLGAGVVFGVVKGSVLVFFSAMLGATAAFLIGRYLARDWIARKIAGNPKFKAIDEAIAREGRKIIFLIRLSPAFPFNVLNYALGLTQVSLKDYVLGTVGILPGTIMYVYLGSLFGSLATIGAGEELSNPQAAMVQWILRIVGLIATVAVTIYVTRVARKALREALPEAADAMPDASSGY